MRILVINSRYGYVGGPERYMFNLIELLQKRGHEVIPFSITYPINEKTKYSDYFVTPLSDDQSVYYKDQKMTWRSVVKTLQRNFYSREVEQNLLRLIRDHRPDFAIVLLYLRKLSPAVLVALHRGGVPFVVRLSDFSMLCPSHNFFRNDAICEKCAQGKIWNSVRYRCVQRSYTASGVNYLATKYHYYKKYFDLVPHFVCPSNLVIQKMIESGWSPNRFTRLPTFTPLSFEGGIVKKQNQILYAGRLEKIKGVHHLLQAFQILINESRLKATLILAGGGDPLYIDSLKEAANNEIKYNVQFVGNVSKEQLSVYYHDSTVSVIPSLVYDNMPNSALESMAAETPVVAPNHGSFPEIINDYETGLLYNYASPEDLANKLREYLTNESLQLILRTKAREYILKHHSPEIHYDILMSVIDKVKSS